MGYQPAWMSKSYATQLALQRLTAEESQQIIQTVLPPQQLSKELMQAIVVRGQGNPFFLEELAYVITEQGAFDLTRAMPETVQAVLSARLDRLPAETKALVQVAAVIGAEVPRALLQAVSGLSDHSLHQHLGRLQEAELFFAGRTFPEPVYAFKHALTQEVAYHSLIRSTRQHYHQRIVEVLVAQFAELVQARPEVVAHHYTEAGLPELAIPYWQRAGDDAVGRSAYREAIAHCTKGLEVLRLLPDTPVRARYELGLQRALAGALLATKGIGAPEVGPVRMRVRDLCAQVGDEEQLCRALLGLTGFHNVRGELHAAHATAAQALRLAPGQSDLWLPLRAHVMMGLALLLIGELVAARAHLEHALTLWDPHEPASLPPHAEQDSVGSCFVHLAQTLGILGYPDQALQYAYAALQRAQAVPHPYSVVYALVHVTWMHQLRHEVQATRQAAEAMLSVCEEQDFSLWRAYGQFCRGWALVAQEQSEEGMALLHHGIVTSSDRLMRPREYAFLAEAYARQGQRDKGLAILTEQIDLVERSDGRFYTAELYRLKGALLL
jgi:tetratricopeptide (TPR) repeat protein